MVFFVSNDAETDYRDTLTERIGPLGDSSLQDYLPARYGGTPIVPVPIFREDLGVGTDESVVIYTDPKNWYSIFRRQVEVESDRDISAGVLIIVVSLRFAGNFRDVNGTGKATEVKVG